jgi:hypothetical protein
VPRWPFLTSTSTSCRILSFGMLLNAKRSGEQNWQPRPQPRVISTLPPPATAPLITGISPLTFERGSNNACRQLSLPLTASAKSGPPAKPSPPLPQQGSRDTPAYTRCSGCSCSCHHIPGRPADYQLLGVELFFSREWWLLSIRQMIYSCVCAKARASSLSGGIYACKKLRHRRIYPIGSWAPQLAP